MDLLSELLDFAAWKNDLLLQITCYEKWGYHFPCEKSGGFHIVTQGICYLRYSEQVVRLERGDVIFIMKGIHHDLVSTPKEKTVSAQALEEKLLTSTSTKIEPITSLVSVRYEVPDRPQHPFFLELPEVILVQSSEIPIGHPIYTTIEMISKEIKSGFGSSLITQRLTDILLYHVIRRWLELNKSTKAGWLKAFKDEKILYALEFIHRDLVFNWTIEVLAQSIGLSRASLAARFKNSLGLTVMQYITQFRLMKGRFLAENSDLSLEGISQQVGYSSAFAYSKAYKRVYGYSPRNPKVHSK